MKDTLFIDVDDTIIANYHKGSGFDLRPGVITQIRVLSRLFNCVWLTCWPQDKIFELFRLLYGSSINRDLQYADWVAEERYHRKADYVLNPVRNQNFWWIEDPLCSEEMKALAESGNLERYIRVEPYGRWGFLDGVNELFRRKGITEGDIRRVGGQPEWFQKEAILTEDVSRENLRDTLTMLKKVADAQSIDMEAKLKVIQDYINHQLYTL